MIYNITCASTNTIDDMSYIGGIDGGYYKIGIDPKKEAESLRRFRTLGYFSKFPDFTRKLYKLLSIYRYTIFSVF